MESVLLHEPRLKQEVGELNRSDGIALATKMLDSVKSTSAPLPLEPLEPLAG